MKAKEAKELVGKLVQYTSNRTRNSMRPKSWGIVQEHVRSEVHIEGDWHDIDTLEIFQVREL